MAKSPNSTPVVSTLRTKLGPITPLRERTIFPKLQQRQTNFFFINVCHVKRDIIILKFVSIILKCSQIEQWCPVTPLSSKLGTPKTKSQCKQDKNITLERWHVHTSPDSSTLLSPGCKIASPRRPPAGGKSSQ